MNEGRGLALMFALDLTATASTDLTVVYTSVHSQSQTVNCARTVRHVGGRCTPYMRFSVWLSVCLSVHYGRPQARRSTLQARAGVLETRFRGAAGGVLRKCTPGTAHWPLVACGRNR